MSGDYRKVGRGSASFDFIDLGMADRAGGNTEQKIKRSGERVWKSMEFEGRWILPQAAHPMEKHSLHGRPRGMEDVPCGRPAL
jgi:hypothetical protein